MLYYDMSDEFWDTDEPGQVWDQEEPVIENTDNMAYVKLELNGLNYTALCNKADTIISKMTGNTAVPAPSPTLLNLTAFCQDLRDKVAASNTARAAAKAATAAMMAAQKALQDALTAEGRYVQTASNGVAEVILSCGMDVRTAGGTSVPGQTVGVVAKMTAYSGTVKLTWKRDVSAVSYVIDCAEMTGPTVGDWAQAALASKTKSNISELTPGRTYVFRVRCVGRDNSLGPWSVAVPVMAP
jgi:hypothetical protein